MMPPIDLLSLSKQINRPVGGQTILIHGDPSTGKTDLAATIAKVPEIKSVNYFGLDNGDETLFTALREGRLTEQDASKINVYRIEDTPTRPLAYETLFKTICTNERKSICVAHGRVMCQDCQKIKEAFQQYDITAQDKTAATIIDTGSQLADSMMSYLCKGKPDNYKPGWDEFGLQGRKLAEFLSVLQAGKTNWVFVTQSIGINIVRGTVDQIAKPEDDDNFVEWRYPLCGSQAMSIKTAKYFGQKILCETRLGKYVAGSSIEYKNHCIIGSRTGWKIEKEKERSLAGLWIKMKGDQSGLGTGK